MPDLPLPELTPGNPENLLSHDARQRIGRAWVEHDLIRKRALSALDTRYRAEPAGCADFMEYLGKGQAGIDFIESRIKAAGVVLRAEAEEYGNLGLPGREFREIMEGSIDEMAYSLEFSTLQRDALKALAGASRAGRKTWLYRKEHGAGSRERPSQSLHGEETPRHSRVRENDRRQPTNGHIDFGGRSGREADAGRGSQSARNHA